VRILSSVLKSPSFNSIEIFTRADLEKIRQCTHLFQPVIPVTLNITLSKTNKIVYFSTRQLKFDFSFKKSRRIGRFTTSNSTQCYISESNICDMYKVVRPKYFSSKASRLIFIFKACTCQNYVPYSTCNSTQISAWWYVDMLIFSVRRWIWVSFLFYFACAVQIWFNLNPSEQGSRRARSDTSCISFRVRSIEVRFYYFYISPFNMIVSWKWSQTQRRWVVVPFRLWWVQFW